MPERYDAMSFICPKTSSSMCSAKRAFGQKCVPHFTWPIVFNVRFLKINVTRKSLDPPFQALFCFAKVSFERTGNSYQSQAGFKIRRIFFGAERSGGAVFEKASGAERSDGAVSMKMVGAERSGGAEFSKIFDFFANFLVFCLKIR